MLSHPGAHRWERACDAAGALRPGSLRASPDKIEALDVPYNPELFKGLARQLREWAPRILSGSDRMDEENENLLEMYVRWLDELGEDLSMYLGDGCCVQILQTIEGRCRGRGNGGDYSVLFLIKSFLLCHLVRSSQQLRTILARAAHLTCPPNLARLFDAALMDKRLPVPDRATVSRFRLKLDAGFMLATRRRLQKKCTSAESAPCHIFFKLDSSPFHNRNWLMCEFECIDASDCMEFFGASVQLFDVAEARRLSHHDAGEAQVGDRAKPSEAELALIENMESLIWHHHLIPTALGTKRASLIRKLHCMFHALYMEVGASDLLGRFLRMIEVVTSDQGVERLASRTVPLPFKSLFPYLNAGLRFDDPDEQQPVDDADDDPSQCDLEVDALEWPGALHILSGALKV